MKLLIAHRWFFALTFSVILIIGAASIAIILNNGQLKDAKRQFQSFKAELKSLLALKIDISEKNIEMSNENLRQIDEIKNKWSNSFGIRSASKTPIECYLNLQRDVEFLKKTALSANIVINSPCSFGFLKYLGTEKLPTLENIPILDQQSQIIKTIIGTLIEAQPKEILFVKREAVQGEADSDDEMFLFPLHRRLDIHEIFSSHAFKVSFIATTETLRLFLNKIESMKTPIFVRDVEVQNYSHDEIKNLTNQGYAVFSVILEILNINVHF